MTGGTGSGMVLMVLCNHCADQSGPTTPIYRGRRGIAEIAFKISISALASAQATKNGGRKKSKRK